MRANCEACGLPQPPDWKAGDLCVHCGKAARHEVRCFWCAKWTPAVGKFCKSCGAETVEERLYGAARMLKDAGTDRFTVPKLLRELPADQIENFSLIYQRHAATLARHVDDLLFLERFLITGGWSVAFEESVIGELPWPDARLQALTLTPLISGDDLAVAKAIYETTPFPQTKFLAACVRLRLDDFAMRDEVSWGLNAETRDEAALALSSYRVLYGPGLESGRELLPILRESKFKREAVVRLALLGDKVQVFRNLLDDKNPETAFMAALTIGDVDRLRLALSGDRLQRLAAGLKLIELGVFAPLAPVLVEGDDELQLQLLKAIRTTAPELRDALYTVMESSKNDRVVDAAGRVLSREGDDVDALRIAKTGSRDIYQSLLQTKTLSPETVYALGVYLVENGDFRMSQYGLADAATSGRMPDDFVPRQFAKADEETRCELCRFGELQLQERGNEELHKFMIQTALGDYPASVRAAAWSSLHRWYYRQEYGSNGPFKIGAEPIVRFFGSVATFIERFIAVLSDPVGLDEVLYFDLIQYLLRYPDDDALPLFVAEERWSMALRDQLVATMRNPAIRSSVRYDCPSLLGFLAGNEEWLVDIHRILMEFKGTDLEGAVTIVLDRLGRQHEDLGEGTRGDSLENHQVNHDFDWQAQMEEQAALERLETLEALANPTPPALTEDDFR